MASFIDHHRSAIADLCQRHGVRRLDVFGSAIRPDFDQVHSDIDLVVEFDPEQVGGTLREYFELKTALESLFGRSVDLVELNAMPDTRLKRIIERTKIPVYAPTTEPPTPLQSPEDSAADSPP